MPAELLSYGREVLARQPFSSLLGAQLDVRAQAVRRRPRHDSQGRIAFASGYLG